MSTRVRCAHRAGENEPRFIAAFDRVRHRVTEMRARVDLSVIDEWIARGAPTTAVR